MAPRLTIAAVLVVAAAVALVGCAYEGKVTGEVGDTLTFTTTPDRQTELKLAVLDFEPVDAADAEAWGIESDGGDVYFMHYSADGAGSTLLWSDWAVVTTSDEVIGADGPRLFPTPALPEDADCEQSPESGSPCEIFVVKSGDAVTSVRYYGVNSGVGVRGSGIGGTEWAAWTVD